MEEGIDPAALRILRERTGLENVYLEQYHTFGHEDRSKKNTLADILDFGHTEEFRNSWLNKRFVSIGYYA
jgi:ADP-ribose pyrophosphatase YjhB (NUDIX family)